FGGTQHGMVPESRPAADRLVRSPNRTQTLPISFAQIKSGRSAVLGKSTMKLAVPDLISNSYFPAIAAVELGFFRREGLDAALELVVPVENALSAMRDGSLEF